MSFCIDLPELNSTQCQVEALQAVFTLIPANGCPRSRTTLPILHNSRFQSQH